MYQESRCPKQMKENHLWVLGVLILAVVLLAVFGVFHRREGFQNVSALIRCPPGYTFFNGPDGASLCCKGSVNPYTHTCEGADSVKTNLCAFTTSTPDPRPAFKGTVLRSCQEITQTQLTNIKGTCPSSLPHFAPKDDANQMCCKNPVELAGESGFACSSADLKDTTQYCIVDGKGTPTVNATDGKMEKLCSEGTLVETTTCPKDSLGRQVFQGVNYILGAREAQHYDIADLEGLAIPTCFRLNEVCIPEEAIAYAQRRGAFTEFDANTWEYSCAVWKKKDRGEEVEEEVRGYISSA